MINARVDSWLEEDDDADAIAALWRTLDDTDPTGVHLLGERARRSSRGADHQVMISPATSSAVRGLNDAAFRFDTSATNIANGSSDLPTDIVEGEMLAPTAYTANAKVLETQAAMTKAMLTSAPKTSCARPLRRSRRPRR